MSDSELWAISRVIESAASTASCRYAVFYRLESQRLYPVAYRGLDSVPVFPVPDSEWLPVGRGIDAIRVHNDLSTEPAVVPSLAPATTLTVRFMVLAPVVAENGRIHGLLLLADARVQTGLSAAKLYAIGTHTLQLSHHDRASQVAEPRPEDGWGPALDRLRLLESVVVHAKDAVLITEARPIDRPGPRIVYCNAAFTTATGFSPDEVVGQTPRLLQNENTSRDALDRLREALERWQPIEIELINQRRDGSEFWVQVSIVPVADRAGEYTHWVSVQRDISERKHAEAVASQARLAEAANAALEAKLQERQRVERSLAYAASHDDLTHLYNRAHIMDRLDRLLTIEPVEASLLFIDMDRFKAVNDSFGHRAGDLLLMQMARRLETCVRSEDSLARVGGDEFIVLINEDRESAVAVEVAERIIAAFGRSFRINDQDIFSSASVGIVQIDHSYDSPDEIIRDADLAMYASKQDGSGQYRLFTDSMRQIAVQTVSLQNDLRQTLIEGELDLAYQPIRTTHGQSIFGVEVLARWHHPSRGTIEPDVFVPLAEEIDMIRELGDWVMRSACRQIRSWNALASDLRLFVNVSASEIRDHRFLDQVDAALADSGLAPARLYLEITENIFIHDAEQVGAVLAKLRRRGINVVLDDFGTGYSSLSYLDRYPIDALKIDRTFVSRVLHAKRTRAIVDSILALGVALEVDIVAEGIETQAELDLLIELGCPFAQGYLLAPPMHESDLARYLSMSREQRAAYDDRP